MNNINIINEINKHLNIYEIAQAVENAIGNNNYKFEIIDDYLIVSDNGVTVKILSDIFLKTHKLNDILYNIKIAMLINEINVRYDNYCLDDEQVDAMLSIVTGLNY